MKTILFTSAFILAGLFAIFSCENAKMESDDSQLSSIRRTTMFNDTVHLLTAQRNIQRYVDACDSLFRKVPGADTVPIRSYQIHASDMLNILGISDSIAYTYPHGRVYLGLDANYHFKLYMTPVNKNDKDTILGPKTGKYVFDLNAPCPSTCDVTSPLYMHCKK